MRTDACGIAQAANQEPYPAPNPFFYSGKGGARTLFRPAE